MSLHWDCLRCLCYVMMRSQLTFLHTPFASLFIGANQYFSLLKVILTVATLGEFHGHIDKAKGSCFCSFPVKMDTAIVLR